MSISHLKDGIVSGVLLGDGWVDTRQDRIRFNHCLEQSKYLEFKLKLMDQLGFSTRFYRLTKVRSNLGLYDCCSGTASGKGVREYRARSLERLLGDLNPLGLLLWWLDDGCLNVHRKLSGSISRFGYLNTQSYGLEGNRFISDMLFEKFGLETRIHVDSKSGLALRDHYRLYLNATNMRKLIDIVRSHIPKVPRCMLYKLDMQYTVNRLEASETFVRHYNF